MILLYLLGIFISFIVFIGSLMSVGIYNQGRFIDKLILSIIFGLDICGGLYLSYLVIMDIYHIFVV